MPDIPNTENEAVAKIAAALKIATEHKDPAGGVFAKDVIARFERAYKKISTVIKEVDEQ